MSRNADTPSQIAGIPVRNSPGSDSSPSTKLKTAFRLVRWIVSRPAGTNTVRQFAHNAATSSSRSVRSFASHPGQATVSICICVDISSVQSISPGNKRGAGKIVLNPTGGTDQGAQRAEYEQQIRE